MQTLVVELYDALRRAGVEEPLARNAASAVMPSGCVQDLATKGDLTSVRGEVSQFRLEMKSDLSELKADLIKWNVGTMVALTALCVAIMRLG